jgi:hypothetical protein
MKKEIKLELVKDESGIVATNEEMGQIVFFDEDEEGRRNFVLYMLDEFINKEINGKEYK